MSENCTIQLHAEGLWHDVAEVSVFGNVQNGWSAATYGGYAANWAVAHAGLRDAHALSCQYPVSLEPFRCAHWPVFLIDMLPQGFGREELLRRIDLPPTFGAKADWQLLLAGAGNPIGHLRVKEAALWLSENATPLHGFTDDEVANRSEDFAEYLAGNGLFVAGSTGVQGEWPKILLTRADDGLLYLDHDLPDARAREHFIVKFSRGGNEDLGCILRHEAPYMELARLLGLRVYAALLYKSRTLFIPRFDRVVSEGGVVRLAQESVASLTGKSGFTHLPTHEEICEELMRQCTDPQAEILEYLKRDVANLALGNKDNHARNSAIQRDFDGRVQLTPLYDFAPMFLHPDGIARRIRWQIGEGVEFNWSTVLDRLCAIADEIRVVSGSDKPILDRQYLIAGMKSMIPVLEKITQCGETMGLEPRVSEYLKGSLLAQTQRLSDLH